jgi:hypothetical protein
MLIEGGLRIELLPLEQLVGGSRARNRGVLGIGLDTTEV